MAGERAGAGVDFEALAANGTVWLGADPAVQFADLSFATPSGRGDDQTR